ncbi:MAG: peptidylprolyl isomerase [bacterium]|nr:peptidylprolyl isomerase [bacterium]
MIHNRKKILAILSLLIIAQAGCSRKQAVLANIGSKVITSTDFTERLKQLPPQYQALIRADEDKKTMLDALVKEQLIVQEAKERNLDKEKTIQTKIDTIVDQILLEEMIKRVRDSQLKPSEAEAKNYYDQHKSEFTGPERIKVAHILVKEKSQAEQALAQLKKGADFGQLAKELSIDSSSSKTGGEMEYFGKGEMVPDFEKGAFALTTPGQLSEPIKTAFGYHIIKLIAKKAAGEKSFEEAKAEVERVVEKSKFDQWLESLKKKWHVKINYEKLKEINITGSSTTGNSEGEK